MSQRPARLFAALLLFCLMSWSPPASATTALRMSLGEMAAASSSVVHGTVVSTQCRWNETGSMIVTDVRIRVLGAAKGSAGGVITVTQPGGELGKLKTEVPGASAFRRGEETVLFLAAGADGSYQVTGLAQGRFEVVEDARSGRKILQGLDGDRLRRLENAGTATRRLVAPDGSVPLNRFMNRVRDLVKPAGEGGGR